MKTLNYKLYIQISSVHVIRCNLNGKLYYQISRTHWFDVIRGHLRKNDFVLRTSMSALRDALRKEFYFI
jgi:hypothetical protein